MESGRKQNVIDFYRLGVSPLFSISAEHGRGVTDLLDEVFKVLPPAPLPDERAEGEIRVALVGRPDVGKSSLLNKLVGHPRAVVDSTPGTTRDAIDTPLWREGREVHLYRHRRDPASGQGIPALGKIYDHQGLEEPGTL